MIDVRRMRVLREVAACGSFSAAADSLSFTQSAISQQVAALERETGAVLLDRGARGVRLTDAGRALVAHADAILARIDDAEEELAALAGLRGGRLRLASFQSAGATLVPRAIAAFSGRHPEVELTLVEAEPEDARGLLRAGEIDLAVVFDFESLPDPFGPELERTPLLDDRYDLVVAAGHPLAARHRVRLADTAGDPWIFPTAASGCRAIIEEACRGAGFAPTVSFQVDETMASQALVAAGMGVTLYPRLALSPLHPGVAACSLGSAAPVRRIWSVRLSEGYRSPAVEAMTQILIEAAEEFSEKPALAAVGAPAVA